MLTPYVHAYNCVFPSSLSVLQLLTLNSLWHLITIHYWTILWSFSQPALDLFSLIILSHLDLSFSYYLSTFHLWVHLRAQISLKPVSVNLDTFLMWIFLCEEKSTGNIKSDLLRLASFFFSSSQNKFLLLLFHFLSIA